MTIARRNRCRSDIWAKYGSTSCIMSSFSLRDGSLIPRRQRRLRSGNPVDGSVSGASGISGLSRFRLESNASRTEHGSSDRGRS